MWKKRGVVHFSMYNDFSQPLKHISNVNGKTSIFILKSNIYVSATTFENYLLFYCF